MPETGSYSKGLYSSGWVFRSQAYRRDFLSVRRCIGTAVVYSDSSTSLSRPVELLTALTAICKVSSPIVLLAILLL